MPDVILVVMLSGDVRNVSGQAVTTPSMLISMSAAALNDATIGLCAALGMQMHTMLHLRDTTLSLPPSGWNRGCTMADAARRMELSARCIVPSVMAFCFQRAPQGAR